ncbi:DUF1326 domain-containing protein [candidate division KSB1 bacterium]|nr:DUF1326 domain-containing protein [candidate division KSB1 bacterium]NIV70742.1 DUF1326 domain-containing protein [Phycisphaerae bacterium]NIR73403.1 DUF1326 domain-containing protein [candidate division KSB1 bacterium]NIS23944.1 DUF1326 domain-containing protein [candidate division KSB1 bacterium]NIT70861.1 DUF1326 domain-containing protein [candidate division KSB1 bacterium]
MKDQITIWVLVFFIMGVMAASVVAQDWAIKADYTESCSCNPACPCLFGSPSTLGYCEGNNLIEIKEGHYGDVRLDGISVVTAFSLGKWLKLYVSENATDEQAKAAVELLKLEQTFGFIYSGQSEILSQEKAPVSIEKTSTNVKFSVPASMVEIEMMKGWEGKPIKIQNLAVPFMRDHTQYKSVTTSHKSKDKEFKHSGTNGLTARIEASGKI